jgi:uncharacterized protein
VPPPTDADVPAFWQRLALPGLVDIHTHFMPKPVMDKVWAYFDRAQLPRRRGWPITYRVGEHEAVAVLGRLGVRAFTAMIYAHKPGMAAWLNTWATGFAARTPACAHTLTFFPEPGVDRYVAEALEAGARVGKVHLSVGAFDPRDPLLDPVWRRLSAAAIPVVVHAGSGPEPGPFTGPGPFAEVLDRHPELTAVIAHMGAPEFAEFLDLAGRHPNVHLDTTVAFTDFMAEHLGAPYPAELVPRLAELADRVVLGSDFPNTPHPYAHQLHALERLGLGDDWLRAVCWRNGARLLGVADPPARP